MGIETAIAIGGLVAGLASAGAGVAGALEGPPKPPPIEKPTTDVEATNQVRQAEAERKRRATTAGGQSSTILTSPLGDTQSGTSGSTLLGQ